MTGPPIAVVTGASRGIGRAISVAFGRQGWHVVINYRRELAEAEATAERVRAAGGSAEARQGDVGDAAQSAALLGGLKRLDVLVNNAGLTWDAPFATMTAAAWDAVIATNLRGILNCTRAAMPLLAAGGGTIINIGSSAAASARAGQANYAASKSGMVGLTRAMGRDLAPQGIGVMAVAPGYTVSDMARAVPKAMMHEALMRIPLARCAEPEEIAAAVLFFSSPLGRGFAGRTIMIDGGRTVFETEIAL